MIETAQHPLYKPCGMAAMLLFRVAGKNAEEHVAISHVLLTKLVVVLPNKGHPSDCAVAYGALETYSAGADLPPHGHLRL